MPWMASRKAEDSKEVRRPLTSRKDTLSECRMVIEKFKLSHLRTQLEFYSQNRERQRHYRGAAAVQPLDTFDCEARAARLLSIVVGAEEMQRDIRLVADHPTVVRGWGDIKQISGGQFGLRSISEGRHGAAGDDHSHMFDIA